MSLNDTPSANRIHTCFFGRRNAGKSSLVNAVTAQDLAVVSDRPGTTPAPVQKARDLLPLGPVVMTDTPGFDDDEQELGSKRVLRTKRVLNKTDIAVLVVDGTKGMDDFDTELLALFREKEIPHLVVFNKADRMPSRPAGVLCVSAQTGEGIETLKNRLGALAPKEDGRKLLADLVCADALVVLVTPIDESAPKGRMILPQVQAIRDLLDHQACCLVTQPQQLPQMLKLLRQPPKLVVTDSQVFESVQKIVPDSIPLTSFSILFARYKGILQQAVQGAFALEQLPEGATILIAEGCTHHRQCEDIGTVKLPKWIQAYTKKQFQFQWCSGTFFPEDLSDIQLVVHCGGCMLPAKEVTARQALAKQYAVPFTNYGILIAYLNGILSRSLAVFPDDFSNQLQ